MPSLRRLGIVVGLGIGGRARTCLRRSIFRTLTWLPHARRGTAELMKRFYRGMLVEGLTPAAALRAAQRGLAANPRWASPYFWAPFILQGDWR